jgi:2'-5' RNA ligase
MLTLWLMPDKETFIKISQLVEDLSAIHENPRFEPHVTLLSGITDFDKRAIEKTRFLAANNAPMKASLTGIEYLEQFYRCLFLRTDDNEDILNLRGIAEELFEHSEVNPFIPHISFLYGSTPIFKENINSTLFEHALKDLNLNRLRLVKTDLTPEYWEILGEFELGI